jgi:hypothetical protein
MRATHSVFLPRRNILQLIFHQNEYSWQMHIKEDTYLEVKLLMTPVVVSYCFARANIAAIPELQNK